MRTRIFCIGLSRTGTSSLITALRVLNIQAIHSLHGGSSSDIDYLSDMILKGDFNLSTFDNSILAYGDIPIPMFYKRLSQQYPNAKFILTTRDIQSWLLSAERWFKTMGVSHFQLDINDQYVPRVNISVTDLLRYLTYGSVEFNRKMYASTYITHNKLVRKYFKDSPDFLEINICDKDSRWEKLCSFLGRKIPNEPFPHINKWDK